MNRSGKVAAAAVALLLTLSLAPATAGARSTAVPGSSTRASRARLGGGGEHTVFVRGDGTVFAWGHDRGTNVPVQVEDLGNAVAVATGAGHSVVLGSDGGVWTWGQGANGQLGRGPMGYGYDPVPARVGGVAEVIGVGAGSATSFAIHADGTLSAWGWNNWGQLGIGTNVDSSVPVTVPGLGGVVAVEGGHYHSIALTSDGRVFAWGWNVDGELGNGTRGLGTESYVPQQLPGLEGVIAIAAGTEHNLALRADGTVWGWGGNVYGQVGDGSNVMRTSPVQVAALDRVVAIAAGPLHSAALRDDGTVWAWGRNEEGQLGTGTTASSSVPVPVASLPGGVTAIGAGAASLALTGAGELWGWGENFHGEVGNGANENVFLPARIGLGDAGATAICSGYYHLAAIDHDGTVWTSGDDRFGQLGADIGAWGMPWIAFPVQTAVEGVKAVASGEFFTFALRLDGTVVAWGVNDFGQLGDGTFADATSPVPVAGLSGVTAIAAGERSGYALRSDGTVWAWGSGGWGALGNGTYLDSGLPVQVAGLTDVVAIAAGPGVHALAVEADGTLWAWGWNQEGQLARDPSTTYASAVPVRVEGLPGGVVAASAGFINSAAVLSDGTVWVWGANMFGQLGSEGGNDTDAFGDPISTVPVEVPGLAGAVDVAGGAHRVTALLADGTARAWGTGYLGDGSIDATQSTTPVRVAAPRRFTSIDSGYVANAGRGADGTLWTWGTGNYGNLGIGESVLFRNVPTLVWALVTRYHLDAPYSIPGGMVTPGGRSVVAQGDSVTYAITPQAGRIVQEVFVDGAPVGALTSYTFTNVAAHHTIEAAFALADATPDAFHLDDRTGVPLGAVVVSSPIIVSGINVPVMIAVSGGEYSVDGGAWSAGPGTVSAGAAVTVRVTASTVHATISAATLSIGGVTDTFSVTTLPSETRTVTALVLSGSGTITPPGATEVAVGGSATYAIAPAAGFRIAYVAVNGVSVGAPTSHTLTDVRADATISASFVPVRYRIAVSSGPKGAVAPSTYSGFQAGANQTYELRPDTGYHVETLTVDGAPVPPAASYTFSDIRADHTIAATFAPNPSYTIEATAGPNGSITPAGATVLLGGQSQSYAVAAAAGHRVDRVLVDGVSRGAVTRYTFYGVAADHTIEASFVPDEYTLTAAVLSGSGTITPAGATIVPGGGSLTYTVSPAAGFEIVYVAVNGASVGAPTSYALTNVRANATISVSFVPVTYTIAVGAGPNGTVVPSTFGGFQAGATQTYELRPSAGFHVATLTVDGAPVAPASSYTFSDIRADHTLAATFAASP